MSALMTTLPTDAEQIVRLVAEVKRLRERDSKWSEMHQTDGDMMKYYSNERGRLLKERDEAREALQEQRRQVHHAYHSAPIGKCKQGICDLEEK